MRPYPATSRREREGVAPRGIGGRSIRFSIPRDGIVTEGGRPQAGSPQISDRAQHIRIMNQCAPTDSWNSLDGVDLGGNNCVMPIEDAIHLRRIDPGRNMARFYRLSSMPSLFGDVCVVREWGRIGRRGRTRIDLYAREAEAAAARLVLELAKRRRGYRDAPGIE
jgi:predicted DNA-binding WGR domain protein